MKKEPIGPGLGHYLDIYGDGTSFEAWLVDALNDIQWLLDPTHVQRKSQASNVCAKIEITAEGLTRLTPEQQQRVKALLRENRAWLRARGLNPRQYIVVTKPAKKSG